MQHDMALYLPSSSFPLSLPTLAGAVTEGTASLHTELSVSQCINKTTLHDQVAQSSHASKLSLYLEADKAVSILCHFSDRNEVRVLAF